jgi:poly(3-hydroxybutyrate) depolymerase
MTNTPAPFRRIFKTPFRQIALFLALVSAPAWGQITAESATTARVQDRTYHCDDAGKDLPYSVFVPTSYDASKPFPLIVALHGLGSSSQQIIRYRGLTDLAEEHGYFVAAPMGYNNHGWYGSLGTGKNRFSERFATGEPDPDNLGELSEKDVFNVLEIVKKEFKIDPNRTFLMGHSMGGGGTLYLGMKHKDLWAGLGAIAPAIYSSPDQLTGIPHMPVIVIQGDSDKLVNVEVTRRWIEKMKQLKMPLQYIEVPGGDHVRVAPDNLPAVFAFFDRHPRLGE